jgi:hypothetical protein
VKRYGEKKNVEWLESITTAQSLNAQLLLRVELERQNLSFDKLRKKEVRMRTTTLKAYHHRAKSLGMLMALSMVGYFLIRVVVES